MRASLLQLGGSGAEDNSRDFKLTHCGCIDSDPDDPTRRLVRVMKRILTVLAMRQELRASRKCCNYRRRQDEQLLEEGQLREEEKHRECAERRNADNSLTYEG